MLPHVVSYLEQFLEGCDGVIDQRVYFSKVIQSINTIEVNLDIIDGTYGFETEKLRTSFNNNLYSCKEPIENIKRKLEALKARYKGMKIPELKPQKEVMDQYNDVLAQDCPWVLSNQINS